MTDKTPEDFAAMLDRFYSGGVLKPEPLVVNEVGQITAEHARQVVQAYRTHYPDMRHIAASMNARPAMVIITDEADCYNDIKGPPVKWGDALADPLTDLKRMRDAVFAASVATKKFTVSLRIANKIARRTMSKRAYRRWRGRNR